MTLNLCCKDTDDCFQEIDSTTARILSKGATKEILGENLSSLIAIGKNGEPVLFIPHRIQPSSKCEQSLNDDESTTLLEITIKVPKHTLRVKKYCVCYPPGGEPPYGCWK